MQETTDVSHLTEMFFTERKREKNSTSALLVVCILEDIFLFIYIPIIWTIQNQSWKGYLSNKCMRAAFDQNYSKYFYLHH